MDGSYCELDDIFLLGLNSQAFVALPRPIDTDKIDIATGRIRFRGHGYSPLDRISFEVTSGGALPAELQPFNFDYTSPLPLGGDLFQIASVVGGNTPIPSFTSAGSGWLIALDQERRIIRNAVAASARLDEKLTAHNPPIKRDVITGQFPPILVWVSSIMTALQTVTTLQFENAEARKAVDQLIAMKKDADANLAAWLEGKPINVRPEDQDTIPENAPRAAAGRPAVPWTTGCL